MSEPNRNTSADSSSSRSGNRSGNNRNRNRNRNRSRNRHQDQGGHSSNGSRRPRNRQGRRRGKKAQPLTFWQKLLKFFGISPKTAKQSQSNQKGRARKENVRDASKRSSGKSARARQKPRVAPDSSAIDGNRLYVGNLSYDAGEHDLEDLFKGVGAVRNVDIVYNRHNHRSKGYGFVEMGNVDEARRAVEVLHDQPFMGRTLIVNSAKSKGAADEGEQVVQETTHSLSDSSSEQ